MKEVFGFIGVIIATLLIIFAIGWAVQGNNFFMYKVFAPMQEQVRREVFEQTKSFNQGTIQELRNYQFEYIKASPDHKAGLRSVILHQIADYDREKLPPDLYAFVQQLEREQRSVK